MTRLSPARLAQASALLVLALPLSAAADATPPAAPGLGGLGGPPVPGVCVLSREAIFGNAKVGQAATARLRQLTADAQAEVDVDRVPLESEMKALEAQKASLPAAQYESRSKPLIVRWEAMQAKAKQRSQEIEATRTKALARIASEAQPVVADVYRARKCGILFARETMLGGNTGADLTPAIVQALDAKITTITFERETLTAAKPANAAGTH